MDDAAELPSGAVVPVEVLAGTSANHSHLEDTCAQRAPDGACSPPPAPSRSPVSSPAAPPAPRRQQHRPHATTPNNTESGETVTIGFSGPAADHGWLGAINSAAIAEAEKYDDVELVVAEGTNDANLQISQVETFINDGVDAIVLLPTDGAALTEVAIKAMEAGIPVINVDREFSSTFAARATDPR